MLRIHCPWCGLRDHEEFTLWGDASRVFPALEADSQAWQQAVYSRPNHRGETREFFQHTLGCRRWLIVARNNLSHEVLWVEPAHQHLEPIGSAAPSEALP